MALLTSYRELLGLLEREGVLHQADVERKSVVIPTSLGGAEGVQLVRWQDADAVLQFIQSTPIEIPPERLAAVEGAILRLNHALAWPGLDLDHATGRIAYRIGLPLLPRGGVEPEEVRASFRASVRAATDLLPTLRRVVAGELAPEGVVADVRRELAGVAAAVSTDPTTSSLPAPATVFQID